MIYESLEKARILIRKQKIRDAAIIIRSIKQDVKKISGAKIDYIQIVNPDTFEQVKNIKGSVVIAVAIWVGKARLIDNILIKF